MSLLNFFKALNEKIAVVAVLAMSSMACVYLFLFLSLTPLIIPSTQTLIMYISSSIIQLVALPLIMLGQAVLNRNAESRTDETHDMVKEELQVLKDEISELRLMQIKIDELHDMAKNNSCHC